MLPFVMRTLSGITPPLYYAFQINHHARTPRHNSYNRYDELGTAQFVTLDAAGRPQRAMQTV